MYLTAYTVTYTLINMLSKATSNAAASSLGCIADDLTGACDLALMLTENGLSTTLTIGSDSAPGVNQAQVIALKSRTSPPTDACRDSQAAAELLLAGGARQLYFKYCSTFDSTPRGNIGPVTRCLMSFTGETLAVMCPAFPAAGRTVIDGVLLVNGVPLAESPMKDHPLTPMLNSSVVTLMDQQTGPGQTGLVRLETVRQGHQAISRALDSQARDGKRFVVIDAESEADLLAIGVSCSQRALVTGGSGLAMGIARNFSGLSDSHEPPIPRYATLPGRPGSTAIIAGSCSAATREQVELALKTYPGIRVDPVELAKGSQSVIGLTQQMLSHLLHGPALLYSSASPDMVSAVHQQIGTNQASVLLESTLAAVSTRLRRAGIHRFVVAGGETAGAVARSMDIRALNIGPGICPGVPWMAGTGTDPLTVAFKSGNFGAPDFFPHAIGLLP